MNISKTNANILTPFSANLFPIKKIISPSFHFCLNAHFNFPLVLRVSAKNHAYDFFCSKYIVCDFDGV